MTHEDSTLFSLARLTKSTQDASIARREEDSGLIDLDRLTRSNASSAVPTALALPRLLPFTAPPPLGVSIEESTLNGLSAVRHGDPRWRRLQIGMYAGFVAVLAMAFGWVFSTALSADSRAPAAPAQTIIVVAPAPSAPPDEARLEDCISRAVPSVGEAPEQSSSELAPAERRRPSVAPRRPAARVPKTTPKSPNTERKTPKTTDPCAHCGGDLGCAMRCSVRGSG